MDKTTRFVKSCKNMRFGRYNTCTNFCPKMPFTNFRSGREMGCSWHGPLVLCKRQHRYQLTLVIPKWIPTAYFYFRPTNIFRSLYLAMAKHVVCFLRIKKKITGQVRVHGKASPITKSQSSGNLCFQPKWWKIKRSKKLFRLQHIELTKKIVLNFAGLEGKTCFILS